MAITGTISFSVAFKVDGKRVVVDDCKLPTLVTGSPYLRGRHLQVVPVKLPKEINEPGKYKIQCIWSYRELVRENDGGKPGRKLFSGTIFSNIIEVEVTE